MATLPEASKAPDFTDWVGLGGLDPTLVKVFTLWRKTTNDGERHAARARAEALAKKSGMTFMQAFEIDDGERMRAAGGDAFFYAFRSIGDAMEAKTPGYKAECAKKRQVEVNAREARKAALIERFGSLEAALAPCEWERLLLDAVKHWRKVCAPPHERWTHDVDGCGGFTHKLPPHVEAAIRGAYPMPVTFPEAVAEHAYWRQRDDDMRALLDDETGDFALDVVAQMRADIIYRLIERDMPVTSAGDLLARVRLMCDRGLEGAGDQERILADLERLAGIEAHPSSAAMDKSPPRSVQGDGCIEAALRAAPSRSDRSIAREFNCSPTTVGKVRASLGLAGAVRSVQRRGQMYQGRYTRSSEGTALHGTPAAAATMAAG